MGNLTIGMQISRLFRCRGTPGGATLLLLGLLLLRALVPSGFMLAQVDGGVSFVLCQPEAMATGHDQHHHASHHLANHDGSGGHDSSPSFHGDTGCPFAQSAGASLLPSLPLLAGGTALLSQAAPRPATQTLPKFGPPRQQSPRGPPSLA